MHRIAWFSVFLSVPLYVSAAGPRDYLLNDAEDIERDLQMLREQSGWSERDERDQESQDVWSLDEERRTGKLEESTEQGLVQIRVDGVPVDLEDVPSRSWFAPYVRSAADLGIVSGYRGLQGCRSGGTALRIRLPSSSLRRSRSWLQA